MQFGEKLKILAEMRDWSIRKIAGKAGIPQQTLDSAMKGSELRVRAAMAVSAAMEVSTDWLFNDALGFDKLEKVPRYAPVGMSIEDIATIHRDAERGAAAMVSERHGSAAAVKSPKSTARGGTGPKRKGA